MAGATTMCKYVEERWERKRMEQLSIMKEKWNWGLKGEEE